MISYQYFASSEWIACELVKLEDCGDVTVSYDDSGIGIFSTKTVDADYVRVST